MGQGGQGEHRDSSLHVILTGQLLYLEEKKLVCFDESGVDNDIDNGNSLPLWACTLSPSPVSFIA